MSKRGFKKTKRGKSVLDPDGQIRQSQLITTYGPGALVDLLDHAVLLSATDHWGYAKTATKDQRFKPIDLWRLRERITKPPYQIDLQAEAGYFRPPPDGSLDEATEWRGIPALRFPEWFVCQSCQTLARWRDLDSAKNGFEHRCRDREKPARAIPVRFIGACPNGHLQDYDWSGFVHERDTDGKRSTCPGPLRLREGSAGDFAQIRVMCACGAGRNLVQAMQEEARPKCFGKQPWVGPYAEEECDARVHLLIRTASNVYFPQQLSALALPEPMTAQKRVEPVVVKFGKADTFEKFVMLRSMLNDEDVERLADISDEEFWDALEANRQGDDEEPPPLRVAEFAQLISAPETAPLDMDLDFSAYQTPTKNLSALFENVVTVDKLREVRALIGFTRIAPSEMDENGEFEGKLGVKRREVGRQEWLPACEVRGEGVFIRVRESALANWEARDAVKERRDALFAGYESWARENGYDLKRRDGSKSRPAPPFLGMRFYMLHTLSHLLINAISLECGYAASAIRERIYSSRGTDEHPPMAGILLHTGTSGSEGTLGGLAAQANSIGAHLQHAIRMGELCSNDPVCANHTPREDRAERFLEGAACHGCLFIAESSCERFNRYLDRALVVPTMGVPSSTAFLNELSDGSLL